MNQQQFEQRHAALWARAEALAAAFQRRGPAPTDAAEFPQLYRRICHHLALARDRQYAAHVTERLERLMLAGHQILYGAHAGWSSALLRFIGGGFPATIRREWRLVLLSLALFYLPAAAMGVAVYAYPELIYTLMDANQTHGMAEMYRPDVPHIGRERGADSDFLMFGVYIWNNIRIGFQTFAGGIVFGLGSVFFLLFNATYIGAVAGYLTQLGYGQIFWPFVAGHGAFELTAIAFAGAAGLKLGVALLAPGRRTRLEALKDAARVSVKIVYGVVGMLVLAAFVEAFWSAATWVSPATKFAVAAVLWSVVLAYFLLLGRGRAA